MVAWTEYTTGERIKVLRGSMTQQALSEAAGVSVHLVQKAEQGRSISLPYLMRLANALGSDVSVLLGEQAPRRAVTRDEREAVRSIGVATHEAAAGRVSDIEPGDLADLTESFNRIWAEYWSGRYQSLGVALPAILRESAAIYQGATGRDRTESAGLLADALQLSAHFANNFGVRDLAYAAVGYATRIVPDSSDELRAARLEAVLSWVYLRDGKPEKAMRIAGDAAARIEPRYSDGDQKQIAVYGNLMTNAAVAASRGGGSNDDARDYMSQAHAAAARAHGESAPYGAVFGPGAAVTQALSVAIALGDHSQATKLIDRPGFDLSSVLPSSQARYLLDVALVRAEAGKWDQAITALHQAHEAAPSFTRTQAIASEVVRRIGDASATKVRRLSALIGVPYVAR